MAGISLIIPTLNRYDRLAECLDSYAYGTVKPTQIVIVNNGRQPLQAVLPESVRRQWQSELVEYVPPRNLGVAGSCNQAIKLSMSEGNAWLHSNDDVVVGHRMLEGLVERYAEAQADGASAKFVAPAHAQGGLFTVFLADPFWLGLKIGWFDDAFYPVYFEDNDYARRLMLSGFGYRNFVEKAGPEWGYVHHTSSTRQLQEAEGHKDLHKDFQRCEAYYVKKWGGLPEQETFTTPFNAEVANDANVK